MKLSEAIAAVKQIAKGRYFSVHLEYTSYSDHNKETLFTVYIDGKAASGYRGSSLISWDRAIEVLKQEMKERNCPLLEVA